MSRVVRLGVLTPSSNTALEPLTSTIVAGLDHVSVHYSRFKVTEISLDTQALNQFDDSKILAAAELLADARVDVIGWSGTAAGWRGFDTDLQLVERIRERTGIPATTAVLALNDLLRLRNIRQLGLVTPYLPDVHQRIIDNYKAIGVEVVANKHMGISVNHDFALVEPARLDELIREVAQAKPEAIATYCTNLRAAQLADRLERDTGVPLLDTVSTTIWGMLRSTGLSSEKIEGWGQLYAWR